MTRAAAELVIGMDFDGTLCPLARRPELARLPAATRRLLRRLAGRPRVRLAVVSGRSLKAVRALVGLRGIYYAGNHGLDIDGPALRWSHPAARASLPRVRRALRDLKRDLKAMPRILLEDKRFSLCVHYRASPTLREALRVKLENAIRPHDRFFLFPGKMIWEIRPRISWNKGHALLRIARAAGPRPRLLYIGDDLTDEEAFRTLGRRALTIRVGPCGRTAARFLVRGQRRVHALLEALDAAASRLIWYDSRRFDA